jgi:hypothetical protein
MADIGGVSRSLSSFVLSKFSLKEKFGFVWEVSDVEIWSAMSVCAVEGGSACIAACRMPVGSASLVMPQEGADTRLFGRPLGNLTALATGKV